MNVSIGRYRIGHAEYHADPCESASLSSSVARTLLERSPLHAWTEHPRLNLAYKPEEREAFDVGSAAHALLLDGEDRMSVVVADSWRTNAAKEARDQARAEGKYPILEHHYAAIFAMRAKALEAIAGCTDLGIGSLSEGVAEESIIWREGASWCRARLDWRSRDCSLILDYKTTSASAKPEAWVRTMIGNGGDVQAAFYTRGNAAAGGPEAARFVFLVQEVDPPYACSLVGLPPSFVELGMDKVKAAIRTWSECMKSGRWPGYPSRVCWVDPPEWHVAAWMERAAGPGGIEYDPAILWQKPAALGFDAERAPL